MKMEVSKLKIISFCKEFITYILVHINNIIHAPVIFSNTYQTGIKVIGEPIVIISLKMTMYI